MKRGSGRIAIVAAVTCLLWGCGSATSSDDDKTTPHLRKESINLTYLNRPEGFVIADPTCTEGEAVESLGQVEVFQWNGRSTEPVEFDFSHVSGKGLASNFQAPVTHGYHEIEHYDCTDGCGPAPYRTEVLHKEGSLNICKQGVKLPRDSVEGIGLSVLAGTTSAFNFYQSLRNSTQPTEPLFLKVLPRYEKIHHYPESAGRESESRSRTATDNAYWKLSPVGAGNYQQSIEVLPHSQEMGSFSLTASEVRFWEIPMVLGHEFGHHVFYTHAPELIKAVSPKLFSSQIWAEHGTGSHPGKPFLPGSLGLADELAGANPDLALVLMPILEAFADLFGQYSQDRERPFENIRCLGGNRDLTVDHFSDSDQTAKSISSTTIASFNRSSGRDFYEDCNRPSAGSLYSLASVLAHGIHSLLSTDEVVDRYRTNREKGELLLAWIEVLNTEMSGYDRKRTNSYLSYAIDRLLDLTLAGRKLSDQQCSVLKRIFPFYLDQAPQPSQERLGSCRGNGALAFRG